MKNLRYLLVFVLLIICGCKVYASNDNQFKLVTSETELEAGDIIIIVNKATKRTIGNDRGNNRAAVSVKIEDDIVVIDETVEIITLEGSSGAWYLYASNLNQGYLGCATSSSGNHLKTNSEKSDYTKASISINDQSEAIIKFSKQKENRNKIRYNSNSGTPIFSCYSSGQSPVQIYKKIDNSPTLSFDKETVEVINGEESLFEAPILTLRKADGTVVENASFKYTSSDVNVVDVEETTGEISFKGVGTTTITATYSGSEDVYNGLTASYVLICRAKPKTPTTLSFDKTGFIVNLGEDFTAPTPKLMADGTEITDATFKYTSSDVNVATVDENGNVTIKAEGSVEITAVYEGNDEYLGSSASYSVTVIDPNRPEENFDFSKPEIYGYKIGDIQNGGKIKSGLVTITQINNGYTLAKFTTDSKGNGCLRFYQLTSLSVSVPFGYVIKSINVVSSSRSFEIDGKKGDSWMGSKRVVSIYIPKDYSAVDIYSMTVTYSKDTKAYTFDQSMQNILPEQDVENANVKIIRTLDNTDWNTFCVPFDISESKIKSVFGEGTVIKAFTSVDGTKMVFTTSADIKAGVPYLVLPGNEIVENPVFSNVTVVSGDAKAITTADNDAYTFVGVYSPTQMATDGTEAFIGSGGRLLFPNEGQNTINGMRAFIRYKNTAVRPVVEIGGDNNTAGIGSIEDNGKKNSQKVYSIGGQYVGSSLTGLQRGIYIINGKKTAIK